MRLSNTRITHSNACIEARGKEQLMRLRNFHFKTSLVDDIS